MTAASPPPLSAVGENLADHWIDEYGDRLLRFAILRVNDRETARDLVQEALVTGLEKWESFRAESEVLTWLTGILKNKILDHYRRTVRKEQKIEGWGMGADGYFRPDGEWVDHWKEEHFPGDFRTDPATLFESGEIRRIIWQCMEKLPQKAKAIFVMKEINQLKTTEICKECGISETNLWVVIHRSKIALRACLEKNL